MWRIYSTADNHRKRKGSWVEQLIWKGEAAYIPYIDAISSGTANILSPQATVISALVDVSKFFNYRAASYDVCAIVNLVIFYYYYELYKQCQVLNCLRGMDLLMTFVNASLSRHNMSVFFLWIQWAVHWNGSPHFCPPFSWDENPDLPWQRFPPGGRPRHPRSASRVPPGVDWWHHPR